MITISQTVTKRHEDGDTSFAKFGPTEDNVLQDLTCTKLMISADWDGSNDLGNPQNWSSSKKMYHMLVPTIVGFTVSLGTSIYPPSIESVSQKFHVGNEVGLVGLTLFVLGLGCGPVIGSPISELFGRRPVYLITIPVFGLFTVGTGLAKDIETVLICRFFAGFFGGPGLAVGAGTLADLITPNRRVFWTSIFTLGPFIATGVGPVIGSYVNSRNGWRWVQWTLVFFALFTFIFSLFTEETYKKVILKKRAKSAGAQLPSGPRGTVLLKHVMMVVLLRPIRMLLTEPIVISFAIYIAFNFAVLFGFLASVPLIFSTVYGFSNEQTGLPFISIAIGCLLSIPTMVLIDRTIYQKHYRRAVKEGRKSIAPEYRLYGAMFGSIGLPVGLFWFAWTARSSVHWIAPIIALIPFSWGNITVFISCVLYMVDTYMAANGASAMAANGLLRYILGAVFPLFILQMYNGMGFHWASSLLAFVTLALLPVPWVLYVWGEGIRKRSKYETWCELS